MYRIESPRDLRYSSDRINIRGIDRDNRLPFTSLLESLILERISEWNSVTDEREKEFCTITNRNHDRKTKGYTRRKK